MVEARQTMVVKREEVSCIMMDVCGCRVVGKEMNPIYGLRTNDLEGGKTELCCRLWHPWRSLYTSRRICLKPVQSRLAPEATRRLPTTVFGFAPWVTYSRKIFHLLSLLSYGDRSNVEYNVSAHVNETMGA